MRSVSEINQDTEQRIIFAKFIEANMKCVTLLLRLHRCPQRVVAKCNTKWMR